MSITEQRLKDYQLQMSIYAEQHNMLLASDALDMIEQLQDDLKDDVDKVVEELEERKAFHERLVEYENKNGTVTKKYQHIKAIDVLSDAIEIVKKGIRKDISE